MPLLDPQAPPRKLALPPFAQKALGDLARSLKGLQKLPRPAALEAITDAWRKLLAACAQPASLDLLLAADTRGCDLLYTACAALNPLEYQIAMPWLKEHPAERADLNAALGELIDGARAKWHEHRAEIVAQLNAAKTQQQRTA